MHTTPSGRDRTKHGSNTATMKTTAERRIKILIDKEADGIQAERLQADGKNQKEGIWLEMAREGTSPALIGIKTASIWRLKTLDIEPFDRRAADDVMLQYLERWF